MFLLYNNKHIINIYCYDYSSPTLIVQEKTNNYFQFWSNKYFGTMISSIIVIGLLVYYLYIFFIIIYVIFIQYCICNNNIDVLYNNTLNYLQPNICKIRNIFFFFFFLSINPMLASHSGSHYWVGAPNFHRENFPRNKLDLKKSTV